MTDKKDRMKALKDLITSWMNDPEEYDEAWGEVEKVVIRREDMNMIYDNVKPKSNDFIIQSEGYILSNPSLEGKIIHLDIQPKWISVKEEEPVKCTPIWVYFPTEDRGSFFEAIYYGNDSWDVSADMYPNSSNYEDFKPTYWMPLPKPPKDKNA